MSHDEDWEPWKWWVLYLFLGVCGITGTLLWAAIFKATWMTLWGEK